MPPAQNEPGALFMTTSKPISSISYNTPNFLMKQVYFLRDSSRIDDFRIILHSKEEAFKKDHFHLLLYPSRRLDTSMLDSLFKEPDPQNPDYPLSCLPWRSSEPLNWLLYVLHDEDYLISHPQTMSCGLYGSFPSPAPSDWCEIR